jgi:very-short-patch-repair endonuclease
MSRAVSRNRRYNPDKLAFARNMRSAPTTAEDLLWQALRAHRLEGWKFRRQQVLLGYIADFYCEEADLCIEVDGAVHAHGDQAAWDAARDEAMKVHGIHVVRLKNEAVLKDLPGTLKKVLKAMEEKPKRKP